MYGKPFIHNGKLLFSIHSFICMMKNNVSSLDQTRELFSLYVVHNICIIKYYSQSSIICNLLLSQYLSFSRLTMNFLPLTCNIKDIWLKMSPDNGGRSRGQHLFTPPTLIHTGEKRTNISRLLVHHNLEIIIQIKRLVFFCRSWKKKKKKTDFIADAQLICLVKCFSFTY